MKKTTFIIVILFCFTITGQLFAQLSLKEIPLKQQIENSSLVVEGKVISKRSFWDANQNLIYTANTVEVYKVFKGKPVKTIEVLTVGGTVGLRALVASHSLKFQKGDVGVFTLYDNDIAINEANKTSNKQFITYSSSQGFYKYDLYYNVVRNPFYIKEGISNSFYNDIIKLVKSKFIEVNEFNVDVLHASKTQSRSAFAPVITGFSPTTASAGTKTVLTIDGTGFGVTQGKVGFRDADEGGENQLMIPIYEDALDTQVLSWSDTQITVEIPSHAGTGDFRVTHDDASTFVSTTDLIITYAESNVEYDIDDNTGSGGSNGPEPKYAFQTQHVGNFLNGGYTWRMQTDFFNDTEQPGARAAFERAFEIWRCTVDVNWIIAASATSTDVGGAASDGFNVIRFDNGAELANGVLGVCYSWYSGCGSWPSLTWYVSELDIVFDDGINWYFGTGATGGSQYDFESVALHELGHGNQLGHVIDNSTPVNNGNDVMNYSIANGSYQRVLTANNIAGASSVHTRSTTINPCPNLPHNTNVMTDYAGVCNLGINDEELNSAITLYPNPAKNQFFIKNSSFIDLQKAEIYDISGRLISEHDLSNASKNQSVNVLGASKGIYFVNIYSENIMITRKMILD